MESYRGFVLLGAAFMIAAGCGSIPGLPPGGGGSLSVTTIASGLDIVWAMAFVPDGRLFFTERSAGAVRVITSGALQGPPVITLPVRAVGEGGLLGLVVDPGFASNRFLYVYYSYTGAGPRNRISRLLVSGTNPTTATEDLVILNDLPGSDARHNGGRLKVGPDGLLYATNGDVNNAALAQDLSSLAGKIVRLTLTGGVAPGNPFGTYVLTYGHRNPQGLAWDPSSTLYATEHGNSSNDEVNRIQPGGNYGWPNAEGPNHPAPFVSPVFVFTQDTCAPSGGVFASGTMIPEWNGDLLFTCLRGVHLHRLRFAGPGSPTVVAEQRLYEGVYGRLRDAIMGPDGAVYMSTSNAGNVNLILRVGR
ncbi:MAG: PQQ-dependent sugar dehydrogenase [Armatimonadota bacterium]